MGNLRPEDAIPSLGTAIIRPLAWGYSSAGRALAWHARGQRFDPAYLHHTNRAVPQSLSSRGLGHHPFTVRTGVRIPVGTPVQLPRPAAHQLRHPVLTYGRSAPAARGLFRYS